MPAHFTPTPRCRRQDGACAAAVWVLHQTVLVANVGDTKCVLARVSDKEGGDKGQLKALTLTKDHLAAYPGERARIAKAGGAVSGDGRLNGRLQVSRSFGDAGFKQVIIYAAVAFRERALSVCTHVRCHVVYLSVPHRCLYNVPAPPVPNSFTRHAVLRPTRCCYCVRRAAVCRRRTSRPLR